MSSHCGIKETGRLYIVLYHFVDPVNPHRKEWKVLKR